MHKEESPARIESDGKVRKGYAKSWRSVLPPLDYTQHRDGIVNISTGEIGSDDVNVPDAVNIGEAMLVKFEANLPEGFHGAIPKMVKTINYVEC